MIKKCDKHYYYKDNMVLYQLCSVSVSERVYVLNHSHENEFRLQVHFHANQTHSHKNGFARLVLKQMHMETQKWPIDYRSKIKLTLKAIFCNRSTETKSAPKCTHLEFHFLLVTVDDF